MSRVSDWIEERGVKEHGGGKEREKLREGRGGEGLKEGEEREHKKDEFGVKLERSANLA